MWPKNVLAASGGLLRETTAGEESRTEGGDKTKIHELIVGENLSRQWGEPHPAWRNTSIRDFRSELRCLPCTCRTS